MIWLGIVVVAIVYPIVLTLLVRRARARGGGGGRYAERTARAPAGFVAIGLALPSMGQLFGFGFLAVGALTAGLHLWWYGDR